MNIEEAIHIIIHSNFSIATDHINNKYVIVSNDEKPHSHCMIHPSRFISEVEVITFAEGLIK